MKHFHSIISDHIFRGKRTGKANDIARLIYGAKFFDNKACLDSLIKIASNDIDPKFYDCIVPVNVRDSRFNVTCSIAKAVCAKLKLKYINALFNQNGSCSSAVEGLSVLVLDDVIYTGKTMRKAINSCRYAGARRVSYFAICRSKTFKINDIK